MANITHFLTAGPKAKSLSAPLFRIATSLIFIIGGLGHFGQHDMMMKRLEQSPWHDLVTLISNPSLLLWLSGIIFILAGISLALGWKTRLSALLLFITLLPITITIHVVPDKSHVGPLFKNIALLGALFYLWANGPGNCALDNEKARIS